MGQASSCTLRYEPVNIRTMSSRSQLTQLACTFDRWVNGRAVLRFSDGQELTVARRFLPKEIHEGQTLEVHFHTEAMAMQQREDLARAILKEILSG